MTDIKDLITDNIDLWTSAIKKRNSQGRGSSKKIQLTGIKKLRKLILELAVRGKLVPQYNNDESVTVLLDKIAAEKTQLIVDKKLKKQKPLLAITNEEKPFEIPTSWNFKRFGDVMFNRDGERKPVSAAERKGIQGKYDYYGASGVIDQVNGFLFDKSLLLIGEDGANLISRSTPIAFLAHGKYWVNNHAHVLDGITTQFLEFIALHINAISLEDYITGTAQPKMNQAKMNSIVVAIPPEAEQHRIVAKVDKLMALCDQLEQQTEQSLIAHQTLVEVLLAALTNSENADDFQISWQRIAEHFDVLFTTEHSIEQLKQTILQLAVMGKLVPQNPSDEPASALLEKIAEEKAQLIADKKIKKQKPIPVITGDEKLFELPNGWVSCSLAELIPQFQNGASSRGDSDGKDIIVLRLADIKNWQVSFVDTRSIAISEKSSERYTLEKGDVLIIRVNGSADIVGRFITCHQKYDAIYCDHFIRMRFPIKCFSSSYLSLLGSSSLIRERIADLFVSTAGQKTVNQTHIGSLSVTLPPIAEQHRIVAKVDELMALCEQLNARLSDAQTTQLHLADAVVENALN
ncbi:MULTISPECIES: restriction endonuclease subunit S [unclassified Colwellia]|uniref:restriction endonuclease subunit S n=1 Tax=unclassified Colwellia TaxID=196834 RepID=UPI0015F69DEA|nr:MULTISPECIES: restriction endonuclease subunit S [unclassified Colwellia]MBA6354892.1 restriction endonuclease subunit S [Colwellia sp. BRX8-3]MBA6360244.1 restriction endonuclease subunit S [Colwellia sp. BRX8-6]MBA6367657.1 restriction endonuclease subunit S [Colwellia sp. BRX8-5]MBA6374725.1 restriction endonuclease subunit S [Colwellia sp. BRX8-2]